MFRRRSLFPLVLLAAAACESAPPTAPEASDPSYILIDATTIGNSLFYVLPPAVTGHPAISATLDRTARPRVEICEWSVADDACVVGGTAFTYTMTSGPGDEVITVSDAHFKVNWDTGLEGVEPGMVFRARVFLVSLLLGSVDFEIGETGRDVKNIKTGDNVGLVDGRALPFNFFIGEGAREEAEGAAETECEAAAGVIDCDIEVVDGSAGGSTTVVQAPGTPQETLAAIVTINPDDVVDENGDPVQDFVLTSQHVVPPPAPVEDIPLDQQIPFFVQVTATDGAGEPVFFQIGAELILCQHPDLGDSGFPGFIPDALHQFLKIFQVREGVTEILETTLDNQENCPGGLHGGLNTVGIKKFSGFGATLPTLPSASTAVVPDGAVGTPTVIDIQAMLDATSGQIFGGDEVVLTVSGANTASPAVVDNGDGTYTAQYTPAVAGTDMIDIRIRNVATGTLEPISGSPFTSIVASGADLVVTSFTHGPASPTTADLITFTATVTNVGSGAAGPSDLELRVGGETSPPTFPVPALASGGSFVVVRNLTLQLAQGYVSEATTDVNDAVTESDESNNTATEVFTVATLEGFGTPTVDGVNSAGEWNAAGRINVFTGGANQGSILYVMNDATNLYLALEIQGDATFTGSDIMEVRFDNALDGVDTFGDDNLSFSTGGGFGDAHFSGSSWGSVDTSSDGAGAAGTSGGVNFFEIAHPLNSLDQGDFALTSGSVVGYCLRYFDDGTSISATQTFMPGCELAVNAQTLYRLIRIAAPPIG